MDEFHNIGVSFADLQSLPPFHFYLKYDHHPALKIKSADFMLRNPKRYFGADREIAFLKDYVLEKSGLYRDSILDFSVPVSKANTTSKATVPSTSSSPETFTPEFGL